MMQRALPPLLPAIFQGHADRFLKPFTEIHIFPHCHLAPAYSVCPKCGSIMEREHTAFRDRCGQRLDWQCCQSAAVIDAEPET